MAEPIPDAFLWLHMPRDGLHRLWPTEALERLYDVRAGRDLHYTEGCGATAHLSPTDMPVLYQLWDMLLYLSGGEGFGLPAWEAMCSGIPVVYSNYSSHAEFLGRARAGLAVGGQLQPEPGTCTLRLIADVEQAVEAVRNLYANRCLAKRLGTNGRSFSERHRSLIQVERWHHIFQECVRQKQTCMSTPRMGRVESTRP